MDDKDAMPNNQPGNTGNSFYAGDNDADQQARATSKNIYNDKTVEWSASEYISHTKGVLWYAGLVGAFFAAAVIVYFISDHQIVPTVVTAMLGVIMAVSAARPPRTLQYSITPDGVQIAHRFYSFANFKSFSMSQDRAIGFISLQPLKRFMPPLIVHYDPNDEDRIVDTLSNFLPFENHKADIVDRISKKIRF
jgi:hypothetical protein